MIAHTNGGSRCSTSDSSRDRRVCASRSCATIARRDTIRTQLIAGQTNRLMKSWFYTAYENAEIFKHVRLKGDDESATEGGS